MGYPQLFTATSAELKPGVNSSPTTSKYISIAALMSSLSEIVNVPPLDQVSQSNVFRNSFQIESKFTQDLSSKVILCQEFKILKLRVVDVKNPFRESRRLSAT